MLLLLAPITGLVLSLTSKGHRRPGSYLSFLKKFLGFLPRQTWPGHAPGGPVKERLISFTGHRSLVL